MPAAAQGMDEVNPEQVDRELAHKAGLFKSSVASELFLQKGQGGKKQDATSVFRVTSSCFFVCVSSFFLTHSAGKVGFGALVRWVGEHCGGIAIFHQFAQVHKH